MNWLTGVKGSQNIGNFVSFFTNISICEYKKLAMVSFLSLFIISFKVLIFKLIEQVIRFSQEPPQISSDFLEFHRFFIQLSYYRKMLHFGHPYRYQLASLTQKWRVLYEKFEEAPSNNSIVPIKTNRRKIWSRFQNCI